MTERDEIIEKYAGRITTDGPKVALVTGASRGIGRATALRLALEGFDVAVNYRVNREAAEKTCKDIRDMGISSYPIRFDVSDRKDVDSGVAWVLDKMGRIDVLVNNAGILRDKSFLKMTPEMWDSVMAVNLNGPFYCSKAVLPGMVARGSGVIVNVASVIGRTGNFGQSNYAAAKAGVIALTKTLAKEFAMKGIRVNAVAPGYIDTEILKDVPAEAMAKLVSTVPLGRLGKPQEVAEVIAFLATDTSSYITGQVIDVNGGCYV